jgi:serine/threonine protein kinase
MVGRTLDRYLIESKLGQGGMGVVYKARDTHLDRAVAIKVLPPDKVTDHTRKQRFAQEAKAASALNHPGIVTIHDIRSDGGIDFIVMEYVAGQSLDHTLPAKGLPVTQALRVGVQIADAMAKAHEAGIIHRDLKPSNVIVTDEGRVKILDFGLAKLFERDDVSAEANTYTTPLTDEGIVVGTAAYMSPEQAEGRRIDARSDVFSFGVLLYEMVTGRQPFEGQSRLATLTKILNEDPAPPSRLAASIPLDVERTILRCLRKDPARRFQTMADLKVALEDLATDSAQTLPAQTAQRRGRWRWAWAALLPLVLAAAYFVWRVPQSANTVTALRAVPFVSLPGTTRSPSFSPDGNQIAFNWTGPSGDNPDVYVQQIGVGSWLRLTTDQGNDYSPIWSPDGRWIAFLRGTNVARSPQQLRLVPPLGGAERQVIEIRPRGFLRSGTLTWCPDSSCLVFTDSTGDNKPDALFIVSLDGEKRQLTRPVDTVYADSNPAISPDGRWLVFRRETAPFNGDLMVHSLRTDLTTDGEPRRLTTPSLSSYNPRWTPDSSEIVFSAREALWRLRISEGATPQRLPFAGEDGVTPIVSLAPLGRPTRLAYVRIYVDVNIWRLETPTVGAPTSAPPSLAVGSNRRDLIPHYSLDGRRVTFTSTRSGENEIWIADATGGNAVQLTSMNANPGWPRWSPDGRLIAFHSNPEGNAEVFLVPSDGGKPRNLTAHPAVDTFPSFSRDGQWVYFTSTRSGATMIWKAPVAGGPPIQVSPGPGEMPIESPDGAYVYYTESVDPSTPSALWRVPVAGGAAEKITDGVAAATFDVLDSGVYYIERDTTSTRLTYFDLATRKPTTVASNIGNVDFGLSVSRDGKAILYSRVDSLVNDLMLVENFR